MMPQPGAPVSGGAGEIHLIVGAGQAGGHAAIAMREAGFTGRILLIGDETHPPYERPPLSKDVLTAAVEPPVSWFHPQDRYRERDIEFLPTTPAAGIDAAAQRLALADGRRLAYDRLLLTTGARARHLTLPGAARVLYLRTLDDARAIRARLPSAGPVAIIGAGVIGLEIASSLRARGAEVVVVEAGPGAMGRSLTPDFARHVASLHRAAGVDLRFGVALSAITPDGVEGDGFSLPAAEVIAGIGIERNTALAETAGLDLDRGILVDEFGRSSNGQIYAAGDVTAFWHPLLGRRLRLEAWRHAQNHGIAVGKNMAGAAAAYDDVPWFWTDQHGVNIQVAGLPEGTVTTVMRGDFGDRSFTGFHLDAAGRLVAATGVNAPREIRAATMLIRAGIPVDPALLADPSVTPQRLAGLAR